ncbi:MAG: hypothetical protein U0R77_05830 [Mycolicibacterium insubricum]|nr:hypothetical protein [Mycobacterium sp.]
MVTLPPTDPRARRRRDAAARSRARTDAADFTAADAVAGIQEFLDRAGDLLADAAHALMAGRVAPAVEAAGTAALLLEAAEKGATLAGNLLASDAASGVTR